MGSEVKSQGRSNQYCKANINQLKMNKYFLKKHYKKQTNKQKTKGEIIQASFSSESVLSQSVEWSTLPCWALEGQVRHWWRAVGGRTDRWGSVWRGSSQQPGSGVVPLEWRLLHSSSTHSLWKYSFFHSPIHSHLGWDHFPLCQFLGNSASLVAFS